MGGAEDDRGDEPELTGNRAGLLLQAKAGLDMVEIRHVTDRILLFGEKRPAAGTARRRLIRHGVHGHLGAGARDLE